MKIALNTIYTALQQDPAVLVHATTEVATILNIVTKFTTKFSIPGTVRKFMYRDTFSTTFSSI